MVSRFVARDKRRENCIRRGTNRYVIRFYKTISEQLLCNRVTRTENKKLYSRTLGRGCSKDKREILKVLRIYGLYNFILNFRILTLTFRVASWRFWNTRCFFLVFFFFFAVRKSTLAQPLVARSCERDSLFRDKVSLVRDDILTNRNDCLQLLCVSCVFFSFFLVIVSRPYLRVRARIKVASSLSSAVRATEVHSFLRSLVTLR